MQHEFKLSAQKRELVFSDATSQGKPVSTSRRDFLETMQDTVFLATPAENAALMPLSEYVLNDPSYYEDAMCRAASLTENELFMALSPMRKDMTVQDARDFVSKIWHDGIDDNARKYAEALKRPFIKSAANDCYEPILPIFCSAANVDQCCIVFQCRLSMMG